MDAMFQADNTRETQFPVTAHIALALGKLLQEHQGGDVVVMDLRELNCWTDFFVVATVTSNTHLQGLERHLKEFVREQGIEIPPKSRPALPRKTVSSDDEWRLIDLGTIVVHLMTVKSRSFYELERLWSTAPVIYSSKSS